MATITEIAPDVYRVSIFNEQIGLQFNHFVIKDEEPMLYHTGYKASFAELRRVWSKIQNAGTRGKSSFCESNSVVS